MPERPTHLQFLILALSVAVLSLAAGALLWRAFQMSAAPAGQTLLLLPEPREIADFSLMDQGGEPFSREQFKGNWSLLFFGFTSCPDICPNTLFQLQQARQILQEVLAEAELPRFYLVSVDPERDTPEKLARYLAYFDPAFTGLSGADEQLRALSMQLGIAYHVSAHEPGATDYNVDHSAALLLLNPEAQLVGVMPAPHDGARIARDLIGLMP